MARQPSVAEVDACRIDHWYPLFRGHTIASRFVPMPEAFVNYLLDDGTVYLPETADPTRAVFAGAGPSEDHDDDGEEDWSEEQGAGDADGAQPLPSFPDFEAAVARAITELEGAVLPKLAWSAPRDAAWIAKNGSLKCSSPGDIFLLLKTSECVAYDLTQAYRHCAPPVPAPGPPQPPLPLVLRNWYEMDQAKEYRCFIRHNRLIAVTQRDPSVQTSLAPVDEVDLLHDLYYLFLDHVRGRFPLRDFVMDIYRPARERLYIIDFNPYGPQCDPVLFSWQELEALGVERDSVPDDDSDDSDDAVDGGLDAGSDALATAADIAAVEQDLTQTDRLNKTLLEAFLRRVNDAGAKVPRFDVPEETADDDFAEEETAGEAAAAAGETTGHESEDESEDEALGLEDVELRLQREPCEMRASAFATHAFPRDVVELASAGNVDAMVEAMQRAQLRGEGSDSDDEDDEGEGEGEHVPAGVR